MTLPSASLRIVGKDLRALRWPLVGWSGMLALSVLRGLDIVPALHALIFPVTVLVPIMAAVLVALAVAADPATCGPSVSDAHHQRPLVVAGAKGFMALLLLSLMAAGHAMVLASHGLSPREVFVLVLEAARQTGAWILFSAALAVCARNKTGWLLGGVSVVVLAFLISAMIDADTGIFAISPLARGSASLLLGGVSVGMIAWAYRAQLTGLPATVRTTILLLTGAVALIAPSDSLADPVSDTSLPRDSTVTVHTTGVVSRVERGALIVDVPVTYPDSSMVVGATGAWTLQFHDGRTIRLRRGARHHRTATLQQPDADITSWGHGRVTRVLEFKYPLDSATRARVDDNLASVTFSLQTDRLLMRRIASFPAQRGGTVAHGGFRLHLTTAGPDARLVMNASEVSIPARRSHLPRSVAYADVPWLVMLPADGSPVRMMNSTSDWPPGNGRRSANWVLPGNDLTGFATTLRPTGAPTGGHGTVIALAGKYAGRVEQGIQATFKR